MGVHPYGLTYFTTNTRVLGPMSDLDIRSSDASISDYPNGQYWDSLVLDE